MPKHSILQNEQIHNNLPRNAFDLSYRHLFTGDVGELLPIYCEHVNPNEHFKINPAVFLRAQTLNTAAFTRMKQNVDFFFIPYRLLGSLIPQLLVGTDYIRSSAVGQSTVQNIYIPGFNYGANITNTSPGCYPINMLGGDYKMSSAADTLVSNPLMKFSDNKIISDKDIFGFDKTTKAVRLLQLLGYGKYIPLGGNTSSTTHLAKLPFNSEAGNFTVSPFNLFAYQKVYMDFYRNPVIEKYDSLITNLDYVMYPSLRTGAVDASSDYPLYNDTMLNTAYYCKHGLFDIRYHNYKRDYFTHQFKDFRNVDFLTNLNFPPSFSGTNLLSSDVDGSFLPAESTGQGSMVGYVPDTSKSSVLGFTISNLRSAYALDKLLAVTQNAKDGSYNEQIVAHFGFNPKVDSQKVQFIGSVDSPIQINDVEATASTDNSTLGQIAGKGVSLTNGSFEFDVREHGIIMGIFYITPECDYPNIGVDPFNLKSQKSDFFTPEYADLGMQPTTSVELVGSNTYKIGEDLGWSAPNPNSIIFGYNNRYAEYKSRVDKVSGEFLDDLNAWVAPRKYVPIKVSPKGASASTFYDIYSDMQLSLDFIKINPSSVDNIFAIEADGTHNQFMCAAQFNVTAIRPMSIFGSPYSNI